ncbi:MAG: hypothetical protein RR415_06665 [Ruthenibacterium sp.]
MKHICALISMLCLAACFMQTAFAAMPSDSSETSDHTVVRLWITDGKNLPDTNENNPLLFVRVVDENGNLIPNADVTLHLVKPRLPDEIVIKSEQSGSTNPAQGDPAAAVTYKVFGPDNPEIQYMVRANAGGYRETVTEPFAINFSVSGTIEVVLKKRSVAEDITVTYVVRENDKADLAFTRADIKKGSAIGSGNVPQVRVPSTPTEKWKLIGYFVNDIQYTADELANLVLSADTVVQIRTMRDDGDEKPIPPVPPAPTPTPTPGGSVPKTGVQDNYQSYIIGLCISLLLLVLIFAILVYRVYQEKKTKQINKKP